MRDGEIVLPAGISGVGGGGAVRGREGGLIAVERGREIALMPEHIADPVMGHGELTLPASISGVGGGQVLPDRVRGLIAVERGREIALIQVHIADAVM